MRYIAGIDLGGTNIKAALVDEDFNIVMRSQVKTPFQKPPETTLSCIIQVIDGMMQDANIKRSVLRGIGIGIPGLTDSRTSIAHEVKFLKWREFNVGKSIEQYFQVPVIAENDGAVNAIGEYYFGAGRGFKNIILLTLGTGLGSGIIIDGKLLRGKDYAAGEVGHMVIESNGEECACGKRGCFESCCSGQALNRYARRFILDYPDSVLLKYTNGCIFTIDGEMICRGFDMGDKACLETINVFVKKLSIGLVNLINIFNPDIIVIGGGVSKAWERILGPIRTLVRKSLMNPLQECAIAVGQLYTDAGVLGACAVMAESLGTMNKDDFGNGMDVDGKK